MILLSNDLDKLAIWLWIAALLKSGEKNNQHLIIVPITEN